MANSVSEAEFNSLQFEKKLTHLKDSQESINSCCHWCLENRKNHKKIVNSWLNVLKRVKVEHRLTLFYLANDVIQYSKRRNYEFVESWSTTLQKATTLVRDEKVKHKILRIFKIWEQRGVYGEEFIADLSGLISVAPTPRKNEEPHEFQSSYLITKIRNCAKLETETDCKLKKFKEVNPKKLDPESLFASLKDRAHVDDVEKEVEDYIKYMEAYVNSLKAELKARNHLISLLTQADTQLQNDKKDVKLVANAYKAFSTRVKNLNKKLEELKPTLSSPVPSPDVNAPSPSPDSDIDLPSAQLPTTTTITTDYAQFANPGFYTPVTTSDNSRFDNNGFTSFIGANMPFDIQSINSSLFNNNLSVTTTGGTAQTTSSYSVNSAISSLFPSLTQTQPPPPPAAIVTPIPAPLTPEFQYSSQVPLLPPPLPPFTKSENYDASGGYNDNYNSNGSISNYGNSTYEPVAAPYQPPTTSYQTPVTTYQSNYQQPTYEQQTSVPSYTPTESNYNSSYVGNEADSYQNSSQYTPTEEYNPEEELELWDPEISWEQPPTELETPESPPNFEKEAYNNPVEYHDNQTHGTGVDVDHRVLPILSNQKVLLDSEHGHRKKDVDHRNLISLTGSPKENSNSPVSWKHKNDQDYRHLSKSKSTKSLVSDQDYRIPFNLENLKLPPPPPPPNQALIKSNLSNKKSLNHSPKKLQDNVESIDMELSDDENNEIGQIEDNTISKNLTVVPIVTENTNSTLEPPPPFPELPDEVDANLFLDELDNDLNSSNDFVPELNECLKEEASNNSNSSIEGSSYPPADHTSKENMWQTNFNEGPPCWIESTYNFRGRGNNHRGNFHNRGHVEFRGRGRGPNWYRGGMFQGPPRGPPRGFNRGNLPRGNRGFVRGNFRGGF